MNWRLFSAASPSPTCAEDVGEVEWDGCGSGGPGKEEQQVMAII